MKRYFVVVGETMDLPKMYVRGDLLLDNRQEKGISFGNQEIAQSFASQILSDDDVMVVCEKVNY